MRNLVCGPFMLGVKYPEGSKHVRADCGHMVYMSPSGQKLMAESTDLRAVCDKCIPANAEYTDPLPATQEELVRTWGAEVAHETIDGLGRAMRKQRP